MGIQNEIATLALDLNEQRDRCQKSSVISLFSNPTVLLEKKLSFHL